MLLSNSPIQLIDIQCKVLLNTSSTGMIAGTRMPVGQRKRLLEVVVRQGISHGILYPREVVCHYVSQGFLLVRWVS